MRKIDKPNIEQDDVCDAFKNLKYKQRILANSNQYVNRLMDLKPLLDDENNMNSADSDYAGYMKKLYTGQFAHRGCSAYKFYQMIRGSQHNCAYCSDPSRSVSQLDHYLPKSIFPSLAISPVNLIPVCSDCNKNKKEYYSVKRDQMIIHPYFDEFADQTFEFIKCTVIESCPIGFAFSIERQQGWSDCTYNRVLKHFNLLKLEDLYRTNFEAVFEPYAYEMKSIFYRENIEALKKAIEIRMNSYLESKTFPWLYAGFNSLLKSKWFFENFPQNLPKIG